MDFKDPSGSSYHTVFTKERLVQAAGDNSLNKTGVGLMIPLPEAETPQAA